MMLTLGDDIFRVQCTFPNVEKFRVQGGCPKMKIQVFLMRKPMKK
jgi:hypothetical protein